MCFYGCYKHHGQNQLRKEKGLIQFTVLSSYSITEGNHGRNSRRKAGDRNWSRNHGEMVLNDLMSIPCSDLLSYTTLYHLREARASLHVMAPPTSMIIQKIHHRLLSRQSDEGIFTMEIPVSSLFFLAQSRK